MVMAMVALDFDCRDCVINNCMSVGLELWLAEALGTNDCDFKKQKIIKKNRSGVIIKKSYVFGCCFVF